jgi:hypothetical protein
MKPLRPLFLARQGYRRRRIMDAARVLPLIGAFLFFVPLLWSGADGRDAATRAGVVYLFLIWVGLILFSFFLSLYLRHDIANPDPPQDEESR